MMHISLNSLLISFLSVSRCGAPLKGNVPTNWRSFCPWTVSVSHNSSRYPVEMDVAQLQCAAHDHCINEKGQKMAEFKCEPVHMDIPVLIKTGATDKDGFCVYKSHFEKVAVGFTCALPKISNAPVAHSGRRREDYSEYDNDNLYSFGEIHF